MSKTKRIITRRHAYLAVAIVAAIIGLYVFLFPSTSALKTPIVSQLQALQVEDIVTAYSYTSKAFQKSTSLSAFTNFVNNYSGLHNNADIKFEDRKFKNGIGMVKAILIARGGLKTQVTYQLVKENNRWKIESMVIIPQGDEANVTPTADNTPAAPVNTPEPTPAATPKPIVAVVKPDSIYRDSRSQFALEYPSSWIYTNTDNGTTIFRKNNNSDENTMVTVQTILSSGEGEPIPSVQQILDYNEDAIKQKAENYKIIEDGLLPPLANNNENFHGRYVVYSYTENGQPMKQLQVIYFKSPKRAQFVIDYISPAKDFDHDLPVARAMISSFTVAS